MTVREYFDNLKRAIESCELVENYQITLDERTREIGFIKAVLFFAQNMELHFREFIDVGKNQKYKYAYHLMKGQILIFRYDNANDIESRTFASYPHHKHLSDGSIIASLEVELRDVLQEIEDATEFI